MASSGLKPSVARRSEGSRQELVDSATKRSLLLSPLEARLLALWDGLASASHLTEMARAQGVVIEARQAAVFLERLGRAGFLAVAPAVDTGLVPDAPGLERLDDAAPALRGDLLIEKPAGTKGVLQVTDPLKNRSFTLYDFEVSIARLLDGKRTAGQVIDAAARIGIPVTLESLRKFVRQLRGYRFIDERRLTGEVPVATAAQPATAPASDAWTPELRELFESAQRLWRQGKPDAALEYLDALLDVSTALEEPRELKARIEAERAGEVLVDLNFDSLHGTPNPLFDARSAPAPAAAPATSPSPSAPRAPASSLLGGVAPATSPSPSAPRAPASSLLGSAAPATSPSPSAPRAPVSSLLGGGGPAASPPRVPHSPALASAGAASPTSPLPPSLGDSVLEQFASGPALALEPDEAPLPPQPSTPSLVVDVDESFTAPKPSTPSLVVDVGESFASSPSQSSLASPAIPSAPQGDLLAMFAAGDASTVSQTAPVSAEEPAPRTSPAPAGLPEDLEEDLAAPPPRRSRAPLLVLGVLALVLLAGGVFLLRPVPRVLTRACQLEAFPPGSVPAPRDGALGAQAVAEGAWVKAGQVVGSMDDAAQKKRLDTIDARLAASAKRRAAFHPADARRLAQATEKAEEARKAYAVATDKLKRADALPAARRRAAVAKAKKAAAAAKTALAKAEGALEALTHAAELERLTAETATLQAEASRLLEATAASGLTAPVAGRLRWLKKPGEPVHSTDEVARVEPGVWKARATPGATLPAGVVVEGTLEAGDAKLEVLGLSVSEASMEGRVEAKGALPATGTLRLNAGTQRAWEALRGE